jgi:hypothetical protein
MKNNQPSTFNVEPPTVVGARSISALNVEGWLLHVSRFRNAIAAGDK